MRFISEDLPCDQQPSTSQYKFVLSWKGRGEDVEFIVSDARATILWGRRHKSITRKLAKSNSPTSPAVYFVQDFFFASSRNRSGQMQLTENRAATIAGWLKLDRSSDGVGTRLRRKWAPCHVKLGPLKSDHTIILYLKGPNDEAIIGMIKLKNFLSGSFFQPVRKSFLFSNHVKIQIIKEISLLYITASMKMINK